MVQGRASRNYDAPILHRTAASRSQTVRRVCERLRSRYGLPRLGNPREPVDDLVYVVLSNKTAPAAAMAAYQRLKSSFPAWDEVADASHRRLVRLLQPAGLANIRASFLRRALRRIRDDFDLCELSGLRGRDEEETLEYLTSLPGVSEKVAKCVMLFGLGMPVLPVDAHVHQIAGRLGWTTHRRADQCGPELASLIPSHRRYAFHVDCIAHGRSTCRPSEPRCDRCCIRSSCMWVRSHE